MSRDDEHESDELPDADPRLGASLIGTAPVVRLWLKGSRLRRRVAAAVERIPTAIRGHFLPASTFLAVGWHDIFECEEHEDGHLFGRASLSLTFEGRHWPSDLERFRQLLFGLPEMHALRDELNSLIPEVAYCFHVA